MTSPLIGVGLIVVVGALAFVLRRSRGSRDETVVLPATPDAPEETLEPARIEPRDGEDDDAETEHVALTSDGLAFAPHGHGVLIAPQRLFHTRPGSAGSLPGVETSDLQRPVPLSPGDLVAVRVVRGSPDLDPWRLETLGRDRDLVVWPFETRDAAEAARALLEQRIVRAARDADGEPVVVTDHDFESAQDELERTLNELNADLPDEHDPATGRER
jgi:hypothetical protein